LEMHVYKSYHSIRRAGLSYRISSGCNVRQRGSVEPINAVIMR
jgi:hypothetical protein